MEKRIPALVALGFGLLIALGLLVSVMLLSEFQQAVDKGQQIAAASSNLRSSVRSLRGDFLEMGETLSTHLLRSDASSRTAVIQGDLARLQAQSAARLQRASSTARGSVLKQDLSALRAYHHRVTEPCQAEVIAWSRTDLLGARRLYLEKYLPAQLEEMRQIDSVLRLATAEVEDLTEQSGLDAARGRLWSRAAIGIFLLFGGIGAFLLRRTVARLMQANEEASRTNRAVLENSIDIILSIDAEGRFTSISGACESTLGYKPQELLGRRYIELVHPDDVEKTEAVAAEIVGGKAVGRFENRYLHKAGSVVNILWASRWSPEQQTFFSIAHDVTESHRAEEELRASEARFRSVTQSVGDGIVSCDEDARIILWNRGAEQIFGWTAEEALGQPLTLIIPQRFRAMHLANMKAYRTRGDFNMVGKTMEVVGLTRKQRELPIDLTISTFTINDQMFFTGIFRDMTARLLIEATLQAERDALAESKRFAESIANSSTGIIYIFDLETRRNTYSNRNMAEFLGFSASEIYALGDHVVDMVVHPDDLQLIHDHHENYAGVTDDRVIDLEFRMKHADGEWHWIWTRERVFQRRADGMPWRIMGTAQDVTERRRIEAELKEAKVEAARREGAERYSFLADSVPMIIWTATPEGYADYFNKAWINYTGQTLEEALEWGWGAALHPEDVEPCVERWNHSLATGEPYEMEYRFRSAADGLYRWHLGQGKPMRDEHGKIVQWVGVCADIHDAKESEQSLQAVNDALGLRVMQRTSELHEAKEAAEAANRAKSEFLANMSHEIRTPMNGLLGMTDLVLESELDDEQRSYLSMAKSSGEALLRLINDILDFSKIEAGKLELEATEFPLRESLEHWMRPLRFRGEQKGLELRTEVASDVPDALVGDPLRLRQIVQNFVDNALKFTNRGSIVIEVESHLAGHDEYCLHFSVTDTGIGIPKEKQRSIFGAFEQVDGSTTRNYGGTGLGLAIVSQLVQQMRGTIWIESQVDEGTTFHFTAWFGLGAGEGVPALHREPEATETIAPSIETSTPALHILLAEDNAVNQALAAALLTKRGHTLSHAANGREAVQLAGAGFFDLILMDVQMPEVDGFAATRLIRKCEEEQGSTRVPIVAMTAHAMAGDRERCLAAGMDDYLSKPLQKKELLALLQRVASRRQPIAPELESSSSPVESRSLRGTSVYSREKLLDEFDVDEELLQRMIGLFQENTPRMLQEVRESVEQRDANHLSRSAHALLSSLGTFGATKAFQLAQELETQAHSPSYEQHERTLAALERHVAEVHAALTSYAAA